MLPKEKELHDTYIIISKNIKKYRLTKNMTQKDLAKKSGYSYAYIRRIEGLKCMKNISLKTLYNIAKSLDVNIGHLFKNNNI